MIAKPVNKDEHWMEKAIEEARKASQKNEVPIGAIAVCDGKIVGRAHNLKEKTQNPLGHAEILLIEKLAKKKKSWRLDDVTIYVTCEPCLMCAGALLQARVKKVVYGCLDPKAGAFGSLYDVSCDKRLNHRIEIQSKILAKECSGLLNDFFKKLRK